MIPSRRETHVFLCVAGFFLCCYLRVLTTGYLELDDLGRVQIGYNLWAEDGRYLTAGLMALLGFGGRMVDVSPLPQLGAIAAMGAAGVLLARATPALGGGRIVLAAILLFATPFYLQNMTYVFDSLSMTAAMVLALAAALLLPRAGLAARAAACAALLAALLLYQPAVNVFVCFAATEILLGVARDPAAARRCATRALLVLAVVSVADGGLVEILRFGRLLVFPGYQAQHAALMAPSEMRHLLARNVGAMLALAGRVIPGRSVYGLLILASLAGGLLLALIGMVGRHGIRDLPLFVLASLALLTGFGGPMLLLRDPVVEPRTLLGIGAMLSSTAWLAMRLVPAGPGSRLTVTGAALLIACFARLDFAYGALLRDLDRYEAGVLPQVAAAVNAEHAATGLGVLQILGAMPYPLVVRHGLERVPGLVPLFDNPLNGISWFGVALLAQYGLEDGIAFRDADPAAASCASYRETGPGYAVGHDAGSLILVFRSHCG